MSLYITSLYYELATLYSSLLQSICSFDDANCYNPKEIFTISN